MAVLDALRRRALAMAGRRPVPHCVILYYHAVPPGQKGRFARQMDLLRRHARPFSLQSEAAFEDGHSYAAVTFDDGFVSVVENALPALQARQIPWTFFVPSGCLGQNPPWIRNGSANRKELILSGELLRELSNNQLVTIGSHSITHPRFTELSAEEAAFEFQRSREDLERITGRRVSLFSFPHGEHNERLLEQARQAGYSDVFTVNPSLAFQSKEQFAHGRVLADPSDWELEFRLKLSGAYRWLGRRSELERQGVKAA